MATHTVTPTPRVLIVGHSFTRRLHRFIEHQIGYLDLLWPIKKDGDNPLNQSKLEVITRSRHKARENVHARAMIGFGFTSDWLKKWREKYDPIIE